MATVSDDHLTRQATQGDPRAFEAIYERYHRDLYRFCLAMLGNPQDAQDALQNTMVKVLRALPGEERHIQLRPWLYRIARNESVETMRRRRDSVELEPEHTVSSLEVADTVEARERLRRLFADLEQLPERQRAALVMRELSGFGFEQIGEAFETSAATARQTVYEARLSLRQMEEGREMSCDQVMRELSDADGRVTRRRELRAHLRGCPSCRAFGESIEARRGELAAIAPLPVALSAAMLHGILSGKASAATIAGSAAGAGTGGAGAGGGIAGTIGAGAGKAVATSAILKAAATVAVVAVVGAGAAGRSGLIHVPLLSGSGSGQSSSQPGGAGGGAAQQGEAATENGEGTRSGGSQGVGGRGTGAKAGGARHATSGGHGKAGNAGHAASGHARSHGSRGLSAPTHGKGTTAHKGATHRSQRGSSASGTARRHSSSNHRASHRRRTPPRHAHHSAAKAPAKPPPPPKKKESAPPPLAPPASGETPSAGTSSATEPPAGG